METQLTLNLRGSMINIIFLMHIPNHVNNYLKNGENSVLLDIDFFFNFYFTYILIDITGMADLNLKLSSLKIIRGVDLAARSGH